MRRYTLFAGVNGAGKTSLYNIAFENDDAVGKRVNIDEIVRKSGDWTNTRLQIEAGKTAITMIRQYIEAGISFHQETTLAGKTIFQSVRNAKEKGFQIVLYYVGVETPEIAQQRVANRVQKGGHGIDNDVIEKRYYKSLRNLKEILKLCDVAVIYDNSGTDLRYIMRIENQVVQWHVDDMPQWLTGINESYL